MTDLERDARQAIDAMLRGEMYSTEYFVVTRPPEEDLVDIELQDNRGLWILRVCGEGLMAWIERGTAAYEAIVKVIEGALGIQMEVVPDDVMANEFLVLGPLGLAAYRAAQKLGEP